MELFVRVDPLVVQGEVPLHASDVAMKELVTRRATRFLKTYALLQSIAFVPIQL